jgi:hypothetical protein
LTLTTAFSFLCLWIWVFNILCFERKKQGWAIGSYSPIWAKLDFILRSPAREFWAKPMKGFKVMFSLTNVCQRKMHHLGF